MVPCSTLPGGAGSGGGIGLDGYLPIDCSSPTCPSGTPSATGAPSTDQIVSGPNIGDLSDYLPEEEIYDIIVSPTTRSWLERKSKLKNQILEAIPGSSNVQLEVIADHAERLRTDTEYRTFVEATFSWSGVMWDIARELIGDKALDI